MHACFVYHACVLCMDSWKKGFKVQLCTKRAAGLLNTRFGCYWCACWGSGCLNVPALFVGFFA